MSGKSEIAKYRYAKMALAYFEETPHYDEVKHLDRQYRDIETAHQQVVDRHQEDMAFLDPIDDIRSDYKERKRFLLESMEHPVNLPKNEILEVMKDQVALIDGLNSSSFLFDYPVSTEDRDRINSLFKEATSATGFTTSSGPSSVPSSLFVANFPITDKGQNDAFNFAKSLLANFPEVELYKDEYGNDSKIYDALVFEDFASYVRSKGHDYDLILDISPGVFEDTMAFENMSPWPEAYDTYDMGISSLKEFVKDHPEMEADYQKWQQATEIGSRFENNEFNFG